MKIYRGRKQTHYFNLPFSYANNVKKIIIHYNQVIDSEEETEVELVRTSKNLNIRGDTVYHTITVSESELFEKGIPVNCYMEVWLKDNMGFDSIDYTFLVEEDAESTDIDTTIDVYLKGYDGTVPCYKEHFYATIVRGTTPRHSFKLPYDLVQAVGSEDGDVSLLRVTYKEGIRTILEKTEKDIEYIDELNNDECLVYFTLTEEETRLFQPTNPNRIVRCQVKVMMSESKEVLVTPVYRMQVLDSLNEENLGEEENE